jgi:hypothetical protein
MRQFLKFLHTLGAIGMMGAMAFLGCFCFDLSLRSALAEKEAQLPSRGPQLRVINTIVNSL